MQSVRMPLTAVPIEAIISPLPAPASAAIPAIIPATIPDTDPQDESQVHIAALQKQLNESKDAIENVKSKNAAIKRKVEDINDHQIPDAERIVRQKIAEKQKAEENIVEAEKIVTALKRSREVLVSHTSTCESQSAG